jgi:hypothetical protein
LKERKQEQAGEEGYRNHSTFANFSEETGPLTLFLLFFYNPLSPDIQIWLVRLLLLPSSEPSHPPTTFDSRYQYWVHIIRTSLSLYLSSNTQRCGFASLSNSVFFSDLCVAILGVLRFSRYSLMQHQHQQPNTCCSKLLPRRWWCAQIWSSNSFFLLHHQSITYPLKMGDFRIQQTWKREGNHNKTTHLEFHAFCQQTPRRASRATAHQESPQSNATCARNRGRGHCRTVGRPGAPDFRSVIPSTENSVVMVFETLDQEPPVLK